MDTKDTIMTLCRAVGPSGFEDATREAAAELLRPYASEIETDAMGNLIARLGCGDPNAPTIMLEAHMDEVGLMITGHEDGGFLRFDAIGGVDPRMLPAQELLILSEPPVRGVVAVMPPHVLSHDEMEKAIGLDSLYIDTGLSTEEAKRLIPPGTPAVIAGEVREMGDGFLCGRGLDDRACAALLIKVFTDLAEMKPRVNVALLLAVQEELGRRGSRTGAFGVNPDSAIAVDVTFARTPDSKPEKTFALGSGAAIGVGPTLNRGMTKRLFALANEHGIAHETEVLPGDSGTDAWFIELTRGGIPTALVSLPVRYMHSPVELMDLKDAEAVAGLLTKYIMNEGAQA